MPYFLPNTVFYWGNSVPDECWNKSWSLYQKLLIDKMKEDTFKLMQ